MELRSILEIVLAVVTALIGGGGVSVQVRHKSLKDRVMALEIKRKAQDRTIDKIYDSVEYIRKKMEGG